MSFFDNINDIVIVDTFK